MPPQINNQQVLNEAVESLQQGGVILYPTETVWGLGCDAQSDAAIRKLYTIKQRDLSQKMISLIAEPSDIFDHVASPPPQILDIISSFERPTSMVFDDVLGLSPLLLDEGRGALRIASTDFDKALIKQSHCTLVSTSANLSGEVTPTSYAQISTHVLAAVDYVVSPDVVHKPMTGQPSDLVYISPAGDIRQLR